MKPMTTANVKDLMTRFRALDDAEREDFLNKAVNDSVVWEPSAEDVEVIAQRSKEIDDGTAEFISKDELMQNLAAHRRQLRERK